MMAATAAVAAGKTAVKNLSPRLAGRNRGDGPVI
jgi:hypothetical protein